MPVFLAPTEAREGTRLPQQAISSSVLCPGLEEATGADMLLSPLATPRMEFVTEALPHQLALKRHCEVGELIQRKTGRDLASSVRDLNYILDKMLKYCERSRLLFVGEMKCDRRGMAVIDGQETNVQCSSIEGAIESWQDHGGYYTHLCTDSRIVPFLNRRLTKLKGILEDPNKMLLPRAPSRPLISSEDSYEVMAVATLAACPDIGAKKGMQLIEHCGSVAWAMKYLSEMRPGEMNGFGPKTIEAARHWLFRDEDLMIDIMSKENRDSDAN